MLKRSRWLLPLLGLSACGVIPLPSQRLPDVSVTISGALSASSRVVYQTTNALSSAVPGSVKRVNITGNLGYSGGVGAKSMTFFIRPSLPTGCTSDPLGGYLICNDAAGGSQIGQAMVSPGQSVPISFAGAALDDAAHAGQGYIGIRLDSGSAAPGDTLSFTNLVAGAYF